MSTVSPPRPEWTAQKQAPMARSPKARTQPLDTSEARNDECVIPPKLPYDVLRGLVISRDPFSEHEVREYVESESHGDRVLHLERMRTEYVFSRRYDVWDVHTEQGRWWVISSPTNLYPQDLFPSLDYTLSLHIGVTARVLSAQHTDATPAERARVAGAFRRWGQACEALARADEAEEFQAVGNHCRMALLDLIGEIASPTMVPAGQPQPQQDNFLAWLDLTADTLAHGPSAQHVRAYLKAVGRDTWQLANWLTHAKNAARHDGRLVAEATLNVIQAFASAVVRNEHGSPERCGKCGSYRLRDIERSDFDGKPGHAVHCEKCGAVAVWQPRRRSSGTRHRTD
jgi:hypothetical protein